MKLANAAARDSYIRFLLAQPLPLEVSAKPWKASRSNDQNAYLFGVCYPPLAEAMGYEVDGPNGIHAYMCGTHFGWIDKPCPKTPNNPDGVYSEPRRTTTRDETGKRDVLKALEFSKFIDTVQRIAAKAGVFIPDAEKAA